MRRIPPARGAVNENHRTLAIGSHKLRARTGSPRIRVGCAQLYAASLNARSTHVVSHMVVMDEVFIRGYSSVLEIFAGLLLDVFLGCVSVGFRDVLRLKQNPGRDISWSQRGPRSGDNFVEKCIEESYGALQDATNLKNQNNASFLNSRTNPTANSICNLTHHLILHLPVEPRKSRLGLEHPTPLVMKRHRKFQQVSIALILPQVPFFIIQRKIPILQVNQQRPRLHL